MATFLAPTWPFTQLDAVVMAGDRVLVVEGWDGRGIFSIPKAGGASTGIASAYVTPYLAVHGDRVFYTDNFGGAELMHVAITGRPSTLLYARDDGTQAGGIDVDESCAYATISSSSREGEILAVPY